MRCYAWLRSAAIAALAAVLLTIALAWVMIRIPASPGSLRGERLVLAAGIVAAVMLSGRRRVTREEAARRLEERLPEFSQQLLTFVDCERKRHNDTFLPLLADQALQTAAAFSPRDLISGPRFAAASMTLLAALGALFFVVFTVANAGVLWARTQAFQIVLQAPRNTVRRGGEWTVAARISGFTPGQATLRIRNAGDREWHSVPMLPAGDDGGFAIQLPAVEHSIDYYAEAQDVRSRVSHLNVVDLPTVTGIRVTYSENAIPARAEDGDIFAPAGAVANVEVQTDRPLTGGRLVFEEGEAIPLTPTARFRVLREDGYHVSVRYAGEDVPISREHSVEVITGEGPAPQPRSLLKGNRVGPMPRGYEQAVSEYYRRLSQQK
ncbi:MAG TPA: hypothetical protein VHC72_00410 [Bryobacteraceae bacterium]|nr:hypothetical protein [Bryobacteraceae bacterium]